MERQDRGEHLGSKSVTGGMIRSSSGGQGKGKGAGGQHNG